MRLTIFTLLLDGYRFLPHHFFTLTKLHDVDWHWVIVEGAAANTGSTNWCKPQRPRVSDDGSNAFILHDIRQHPRITHISKPWWPGGKDEMVMAALNTIKEPTVLLQCDVDELWESEQLATLALLFSMREEANCARFDCVYMVGPNLKVVGRNCWGMQNGEFLRAWRYEPGMIMRHEPPHLEGVNGPNENCISNQDTREHGLVFWHWAYAFEDQVGYKQRFYGYPTAVDGWRRLQDYQGPFPTRLQPFFPWVNGDPLVDLLHRP